MPPVNNGDSNKYSLPSPIGDGPVSVPVPTSTDDQTNNTAQTDSAAIKPVQAPSTANTSVASSTMNADSNPLSADDGDLIEKEWVNKAKQIIEQTRNDPYSQSKEMNTFRADYMKKRYNKDIKVEE